MKLKLPEHETWMSSALCEGRAPLYEVPEMESGRGHYTIEMKWEYLQRANLCYECPVMIQCLESASEDDKWWTIRGGEMPGAMAATKATFPFPIRETPSGVLIRTCKNGHPYDTTPRYVDGRGSYCGACRAEARQKETERVSKKRLRARQDKGIALSDEWLEKGVCPNGHDIDGASLIDRLGQCRTCRAEITKAARAEYEKERLRKVSARRKEERAARRVDAIREAFAVQLVYDDKSPDASLIQHAHDLGAVPTQVPS